MLQAQTARAAARNEDADQRRYDLNKGFFRRPFSGGQFKRTMRSADTVEGSNVGFKEDLVSQWKHLKPRTHQARAQEQPEIADPALSEADLREQEFARQRELRQQEASNGEYVGFDDSAPIRFVEPAHWTPFSEKRTDEHVGAVDNGDKSSEVAWQPTMLSNYEKPVRPAKKLSEISAEEHGPSQDARATEWRKPAVQDETTQSPSRRGSMERAAERRPKAQRSRRETDVEEEDMDFERYQRIERKKQDKRRKEKAQAAGPTPIYLPEYISVSNLATVLHVRLEVFTAKLEDLGFTDLTPDYVLNAEDSGLIAMEYNFEPIIESAEEAQEQDLRAAPLPADMSALPPRPPVVTIMGHVDHGKTTILDYLRKSSVAATEFGGITQHIGAFSVPLSSGKTITFLDTPGHAAFLSMRRRGANVTDIVILVVAADDSVKPQTIEAIKHARAAQVPVIVAINKMDKEDANAQLVKQDLARHGVEVEDFGGDVQAIPVSGKTGLGMQELEEATVTLSEILDHRAQQDGVVEGWVLEATTRKAGRVATVLIRRGTLRRGTVLVAGRTWTKVRTLKNEAGVNVEEAGPGMPIEVDGWRDQPAAGDEALQAEDEQRATAVVQYREEQDERIKTAIDMEAINESRRLEAERREREEAFAAAEAESKAAPSAIPEGNTGAKEVHFIIKADVSGSVEAVSSTLLALGTPEVVPRILRSGVGPVSQFDIDHAAVAKGHIIAFNTSIGARLRGEAEKKAVSLLEQNIIYRVVDDVKAKLSESLPPVTTQRVTGEAEILQSFGISVKRATQMIAGCRVRNGMINLGSKVRVLRGKDKNVVFTGKSPIQEVSGSAQMLLVYSGKLSSLKNRKKEVTEMRKDSECGMAFEDWEAFEVGDQVQCFDEISEKRQL